MGIAKYNKKGMYNGYDKKNKEREALDYYSTPTEEVENILSMINIGEGTILEPCAGGGHMLKGIYNIFPDASVIATDIQDRACKDFEIKTGKEYDFLSDSYPIKNIDYIIMNPPYSVIEPFVMKSLSIANKGVLMLGRLQFLEGENRFKNIFSEYPPNDVYVYVDRISCYKNGNIQEKMASAQAYAWFYWDLTKADKKSYVHWIRRMNKK